MLNFAYGYFVARISRAVAGQCCLAAAVCVGLGVGSGNAQTQPAGESAVTTAPATQPAGELAVATAPATQPAQVIPQEAQDAITAGRYDVAAALLEPLARADSASFEVLAKYGACLDLLAIKAADDQTVEGRARYKEKAKEAVEILSRASMIGLKDPVLPAKPELRAKTEMLLRRVLVLDPRNGSALGALGRLYQDNGQSQQATALYLDYIKTTAGGADYRAQIELGRLLVAQKLWRQAVELLEKIRGPAGLDADCELVRAYQVGKQWQKALDVANRAVKQADETASADSPQHFPDAYLTRAALFLDKDLDSNLRKIQGIVLEDAMKDALKGLQEAPKALAANPDDEQNWQKLTRWRQTAAGIAEVFKQILPRDPNQNPALWIDLAKLIDGVSELTREVYAYDALTQLSAGARADNASVGLLVELAKRQRDLGQAAAAVKTAERVLARDSSNAIARQIRDTAGKREAK